jgi:thioredoxin-related protein
MRLRRVAQLTVNSLLLIGSVALIVVVVYNTIRVAHSNMTDVGPAIGTKIDIPEVSWKESRKTVVLFASTHCHFCTASADFYRRLHSLTEARGIPIVAVFPQTNMEATAYLAKLNIPIAKVRRASPTDLNVPATPTLIIVDSEGRITDSWVGQLPSQVEKEVFSKL